MDEPGTVAIIGAGFSGLLTALRLLLAPDGPKVVLIERSPGFGRGAAYASSSPHHLLNVRASNMSAFVEQPAHFLEWLGKPDGETADVFVTRERYGRYLQSILRRATSDGRATGRLALEHDAVTAVVPAGVGWEIELALGRRLRADAVVLALGNLPPPPPPEAEETLLRSPRYVSNPWAFDPESLPDTGEALLLGAGLTAVDVALTLHAARPQIRILALSRHGLAPRAHAVTTGPVIAGPAPRGSPATLLAELRPRLDEDWRQLVDTLRPHVQGLWRTWTEGQRAAFLRHLRPWWDASRHRLAPAVAERVARLQADGVLTLVAGRLRRLRLTDKGVEAEWTPRGGGRAQRRTFAVAVNCSGPCGDLEHATDPLIRQMLKDGLVRPDAHRLGIDADARSRVIDAAGEAQDSLFAVGPITRGQFYEITSVPDIRIQAADCAGAILNLLALRSRNEAAGPSDRTLSELTTFISQRLDELDVELGSLKFARRVRNAWELRGRRAALGELALWLDARRKAR